MDPSYHRQLRRLARLYNVQPEYYDQAGKLIRSSAAGLTRILQALGAPVARSADIPGALRERRLRLQQDCIPPVLVVWDDAAPKLRLTLPDRHAADLLRYRVDLEDGETCTGEITLNGTGNAQTREVEGLRYRVVRPTLPLKLPHGYHQLTLEFSGEIFHACVIAAPSRVYAPSAEHKSWGVFLPLYALRSQRSWGAGDFTDLGRLMTWVAQLGGDVVSTMPLLAAFLREAVEISPYSPVSRLFWNEFYIDPTEAPEFQRCAAARRMVNDRSLQCRVEGLNQSAEVEYVEAMALKRRVLEELARCAMVSPLPAFEHFIASHPRVQDYATFRAAGERLQVPWRRWPDRMRDGSIEPGDIDPAARSYHLYVQWLAQEQLRSLAEKVQQRKVGLNLDLPLGVHTDGYDVWRERASFAMEMHGGAPPDLYFTKGQDWGFAPLHPEALRAKAYDYFIAAIRHHLQFADLLRIDHVMGLHRLYWVPQGMAPAEGAYVRYHAEELYAILSLESHRHRARIVGENLGTVPDNVIQSMRRRNVYGMYVVELEIKPDQQPILGEIPAHSVASLDTHDMPMFAAFWDGLDIEDRLRLGLLDALAAEKERAKLAATKKPLLELLTKEGRLPDNDSALESILRAFLELLAVGPDQVMLVNLEDLWGETSPQNIPGTLEYGNWRRKARLSLEQFTGDARVKNVLRNIDRLRKEGTSSCR